MTTYYVTCQNDVSGQSTTIQVSGHDPLEASLRATARCQREWNTVQVSSVFVSTTKPKIEKVQPVNERPRYERVAATNPLAERDAASCVPAKPVQRSLL